MTGIPERLDQVETDLADVETQLAAGELDEATAARLRSTYQAERDGILATDEIAENSGPRGRVIAGVAILVLGLVGAGIAVARSAEDRNPGDLITGGLPAVDLSTITNEEMEEIVAQFPEVTTMRLALADRYFNDAQFSDALGHYLTVLDQEPSNPRALANIGWMTYLSDQPEIAERYVEQSLASDAGYSQAYFFLGAIRLYGLGDASGAVPPLERLLEFDDLPQEIRDQAAELLDEARAGA
ncbi:MAG: hypothetical protein KJN71_05820 [Acidimicrobiia bacterium]|nr:hypothetical protein [Acidimicrobiia bacterium]